MATMIEIKHKSTGDVLHVVDADTLVGADLRGKALRGAYLKGANLLGADLSGANLGGANLIGSNLRRAELLAAFLGRAKLQGSDLSQANLNDVDLSQARLGWTVFAYCLNLHDAKGLERVVHHGPSALDRHTLQASIHKLPDVFLEGCGYTQLEIEKLRDLYREDRIASYSCFISHGEPDLPFAERLLADLRQNNVTCWHYKSNMRGGADWDDQVYRAIEDYDKLILVCSRSAVYRKNVVNEILHAINAEHETGKQKLFPIRLDDHILSQEMLDDELRHVKADLWPGVWVEEVKRKHIPDFSVWDTDNAIYQREFKNLLEALQKSDAKDALRYAHVEWRAGGRSVLALHLF